jgi:hypothetical protein
MAITGYCICIGRGGCLQSHRRTHAELQLVQNHGRVHPLAIAHGAWCSRSCVAAKRASLALHLVCVCVGGGGQQLPLQQNASRVLNSSNQHDQPAVGAVH